MRCLGDLNPDGAPGVLRRFSGELCAGPRTVAGRARHVFTSWASEKKGAGECMCDSLWRCRVVHLFPHAPLCSSFGHQPTPPPALCHCCSFKRPGSGCAVWEI